MKIEIIQGDITKEETGAIVNAANPALAGGGGVDGAIHRAAGPELLEACRKIIAEIGKCPPGEAVITDGFRLKSRYVIHTVGPVWHGGIRGERELLENCYRNCMRLAGENGIESVSFPNISTGVYGFPKQEAARIVGAFFKGLADNDSSSVKTIRFVCFDRENYTLYRTEFGYD
ncbi:MAG: O-acetyl-ADP-ribose deacetylase [Spirochaetaceae bacterium]|nr:O-acetyl-ADP-ribose deacetylase [Spirochaetaceae bacterium]